MFTIFLRMGGHDKFRRVQIRGTAIVAGQASIFLLILLNFIHLVTSNAFQIDPTGWQGRKIAGRQKPLVVTPLSATLDLAEEKFSTKPLAKIGSPKFLIRWKGESVEGYSMQFRHMEFLGAVRALDNSIDTDAFRFENALSWNDVLGVHEVKLRAFNNAMQYLTIDPFSPDHSPESLVDVFKRAVERCSLIHSMYRVVCHGTTYEELGTTALENGGFGDMYKGSRNANATWCVRAHLYADGCIDGKKATRYGKRTASNTMEHEALHALKPLLLRFGGRVDLGEPDCKITVMDGVQGSKNKILTRLVALGPQISIIAPKTRICVTNTPLCPIAAFTMCNVAGIRDGMTVLDPFAGSCSILMAASMIAPGCSTVAIEIAPDWVVNRKEIQRDFETRNLTLPLALIRGDCADRSVRTRAQSLIKNKPFDLIITDPPYGIRESTNYNTLSPTEDLFTFLAHDRESNAPLLNPKGGKLVLFVPVTSEESLESCLPNKELMERAGLELEQFQEQPLSLKLSRWLVCFRCRRPENPPTP